MSNITVVMSCLNNALTIRRAVRSVLDQGAKMVVVDGGSTDGTLEFLEGLDRKYPLQLRLMVFDGCNQAKGLNHALDRVTSRYAMQLDGDDWLEPGAIAALNDAVGDKRFVYGSTRYWGIESRLWKPPAFQAEDFYRSFPALYAFAWPIDAELRYTVTEARNLGGADWGLCLKLIERGYSGLVLEGVILNYVNAANNTSAALTADDKQNMLNRLRTEFPKIEAVSL